LTEKLNSTGEDLPRPRVRNENPKIAFRKDGESDPSSAAKPPRNVNHSVDYGQPRSKHIAGKPVDISLCFPFAENQTKFEIETNNSSKGQKNISKVEQICIPQRKEAKNGYDIKQTHCESLKVNLDDVEKESYRTLTSVFCSNRDLKDSLDDLRFMKYDDSNSVIKDVVQKHVERAYRNIDIIKRNFKKNNRKYLFSDCLGTFF